MNARQLLALQLGELMIANAEAAAQNEALLQKLAALQATPTEAKPTVEPAE